MTIHMEKHDNTDKLLGEIFQTAGLHKPGKNFSMNVMERVGELEIRKSRQPDWEMILTIMAITVSVGIVIAVFPETFRQIFSRTGLESLSGYIFRLFKGLFDVRILSGTGASIVFVTILTGSGLLLLDKILSGLKSERAFLF